MSAPGKYAFYFDSGSCSGCKACQMACKDKNDLGPGILWRKVYEIVGGSWRHEGGLWVPGVYAYNISLACNHCEDPACLKACPTKAITRRADGIVFMDPRKCVGCRYCEWSCPYGAPRYDARRGIMTKCDFCADLIGAGGRPACVAACPMRALDFGSLEALREKYEGTDSIFPLPVASTMKPSLLIRPHPGAGPARSPMLSPALQSGDEKRGSGLTPHKPRHSGRGVEGLTGEGRSRIANAEET
jgi:anaerobic dimethyl sulfoxide reductase subunit B (iron-sulfur subunit)